MNASEGKRRARILIIEDSATVQRLTKRILTFEIKYEISFAHNGAEGLAMIKASEPFDIVLSDIDMPVMDGEQCIREIRMLDDPRKANVPVIACTGNAKQRTMMDFKGMGFTDSFMKPVNYPGLIKKVKPILDKLWKKG